jgi:hypothetical protein
LRTLRGYIGKNTRRLTVAVQLKPGGTAEDEERAIRFFERYFENQQIFIFWGTCKDFLNQLGTRWQASTRTTGRDATASGAP